MFANRHDAGRQLAERLAELRLHDPIILGIPRGGVVVAAVIADALNADLDVTLARKLRAPNQPELAVGSVAEDGEAHLTMDPSRLPGLTDDYIEQEAAFQRREIERRQQLYRRDTPPPGVEDRTVIVVDDGIATGSTMIAALDALRPKHPRELIAALPVAPPSRLPDIEQRCDRVVCLHAPENYFAVGQFYDDFREVTDDDVVQLLRESANRS